MTSGGIAQRAPMPIAMYSLAGSSLVSGITRKKKTRATRPPSMKRP